MSIGKNIRRLRIFHGLSQKEFALIAGVSDKAVSTWENEIKEPRMGVIQKIADHFGLKKSNLIEDDGLDINLSPSPVNVKDIIRERRVILGLTMKEVADKVGVSEATISRWESGEIANMRRGAISSLSKALNISPNEIMGWDPAPDSSPLAAVPQYTPAEQSHLEKYRAITDDHKDAIDNQLDYFFTLDTKSKLGSGLSTAGDC